MTGEIAIHFLKAAERLAKVQAGSLILCPSAPYPGAPGDKSARRSCAASLVRYGGGKRDGSSGTLAQNSLSPADGPLQVSLSVRHSIF